MPTRFLSESICTSDQIEMLTPCDEILFYRLIVNADDYGRFDARLPILKSRLFPLKSIDEQQIELSLSALSDAGLIVLYKVNGRPYVWLTGWNNFQNTRAKKSKYPSPDDGEPYTHAAEFKQEHTVAEKCKQMIADDCKAVPEEIQARKKSSQFVPPSVLEVAAYCRERGNGVDASRFVDFYTSKGWMVGKAKMKDWKASVRTWEKDNGTSAQRPKKSVQDRNSYTPEFIPSGDEENPFSVVRSGGTR